MTTQSARIIEPSIDVAPTTAGVPGDVIAGRYELLESLPGEASWVAYEARDVRDDMALVLTQVPDQIARTSHGLERLEDVVRAASRLRHPNLVVPLDLVHDGGRYFVVEPQIVADRLDRRADEAGLAAPEALQAVRDLADALACAHDAGVVHGAVGPRNVLVAAQGSPRVWLTGFALGALVPEGGPFPAALVSQAAPELFTSGADVRTDVFGIGLILFALFEGRPFLSGDARAVEELLRHGTAPLVPRFSRALPAGLSALVTRAVRRQAEGRHQKMAHVRAELDGCLRSIAREPIAPVRPVAVPRAATVAPSEPVAPPPAPEPVVEPVVSVPSAPAAVVVEPETVAPPAVPAAEVRPAQKEARRARTPKKAKARKQAAAPVAKTAPVEAPAPVEARRPEATAPVAVAAPVEIAPPVNAVAASVDVAPPANAVAAPVAVVPQTATDTAPPADAAPSDAGAVSEASVATPAEAPTVARVGEPAAQRRILATVLAVSISLGFCWGLVFALWPSQPTYVVDASVPAAVAATELVGPMPRAATARPAAKPQVARAAAAPTPGQRTAPSARKSLRR